MGAVLTFFLFELILGAKKETKEKAELEEKERHAKAEAEQAEKQRLIVELRSKDNATALNALAQIKAKGWHKDGTLEGANLSQANLQGADLWQAHLQGVGLLGANLQAANMDKANLQGAGMWAANLQGANLWQANLYKANLEGANLRAAELWQANLQGAQLQEVWFDEKTVLPDAKPLQDNESNFKLDELGNLIFDKYWTPETDMRRYTDPNHPDFWQPEWVKVQDNR